METQLAQENCCVHVAQFLGHESLQLAQQNCCFSFQPAPTVLSPPILPHPPKDNATQRYPVPEQKREKQTKKPDSLL